MDSLYPDPDREPFAPPFSPPMAPPPQPIGPGIAHDGIPKPIGDVPVHRPGKPLTPRVYPDEPQRIELKAHPMPRSRWMPDQVGPPPRVAKPPRVPRLR